MKRLLFKQEPLHSFHRFSHIGTGALWMLEYVSQFALLPSGILINAFLVPSSIGRVQSCHKKRLFLIKKTTFLN